MLNRFVVSGVIATDPRSLITENGVSITSFRLAVFDRHFDRQTQEWVSGQTSFFSVSSFRNLGSNLAESIKKGDWVLVSGRLKLREWSNDTQSGINAEIEAESLGHDLRYGVSSFTKSTTRALEQSEVKNSACSSLS